jgi:hypothetical protein
MRGAFTRVLLALTVGLAASAVLWYWMAARFAVLARVKPTLAVEAVLLAGAGLALAGVLALALRPWHKYAPDGTERYRARVIGAFLPFAIFCILMSSMWATRGGSLIAGLMSNSLMAFMFLAMGFGGIVVRRRGTTPRCAKCEYEMDAEAERSEDADARCPECGAFWKRPGGRIRGDKMFQRWPIAAAVVCGGLGLAAMVMQFSGRAAMARALPTSSLIREVTGAPRGFTMDEWAALAGRTLGDHQKIRLAEGLLRLRERRQYLAREADAWFESAVLAGDLPQELRDRYFSGMLDVFIDAPDRAIPGREISIGLGSDHRGSLSTPGLTTLRVYVIFAGFSIDGGPPQAAAGAPETGIMFGRVRRAFGRLERTRDPSPMIGVVPEREGEMRVRAEYWLIVAPQEPTRPVTYDADGVPTVAPGTAWVERRTVEKVIAVEPE